MAMSTRRKTTFPPSLAPSPLPPSIEQHVFEPTKEDKEERIVAIGRQSTRATQDEVTNVPWVRKVVGHHVRLVTVGGHHFIQDPLTCNAKLVPYYPTRCSLWANRALKINLLSPPSILNRPLKLRTKSLVFVTSIPD